MKMLMAKHHAEQQKMLEEGKDEKDQRVKDK